jgi:hypothetical protein
MSSGLPDQQGKNFKQFAGADIFTKLARQKPLLLKIRQTYNLSCFVLYCFIKSFYHCQVEHKSRMRPLAPLSQKSQHAGIREEE